MNRYHLIVYIATSRHYFHFFEGFVESLKNIEGKLGKVHLAVVTDQKVPGVPYPMETFYAEHLPWPIIALMKFYYINKAIASFKRKINYNPEKDHVVVTFVDSKTLFNTFDYDKFYKIDKLTVPPHCLSPNYPTDYVKLQIWYHNQNTDAGFDEDYTYCNSGFFSGDLEIMERFCQQCHSWVSHDLCNRRLPAMDDESYLNKWVVTHKDLVHYLPQGEFIDFPPGKTMAEMNAMLLLRDHSDVEWYRYCVKEGKYVIKDE